MVGIKKNKIGSPKIRRDQMIYRSPCEVSKKQPKLVHPKCGSVQMQAGWQGDTGAFSRPEWRGGQDKVAVLRSHRTQLLTFHGVGIKKDQIGSPILVQGQRSLRGKR